VAIRGVRLWGGAPALAQPATTTTLANRDAIPTPADSTAAAPQAAPRPACGERSAPKAPGEGGCPQTDSAKSAPHPDPLSRSRIYPTSAADSDRTRVNPSSVASGERERTVQAERERTETPAA